MSGRVNGTGQGWKRTANLPSQHLYSIVGHCRAHIVPSNFSYFAGCEDADASSGAWNLMGWNSVGTFELTSASGSFSFTRQPAQNEWFQFAITCSGANNLLGYLRRRTDVTYEISTAHNAGTFTMARLSLGNDSYDEWASVDLFACYVYDAVLTEAQIARHFFQCLPPKELMANLNTSFMGWETGDFAKDFYSPNARNWTEGSGVTKQSNPPIAFGWGEEDTVDLASGGPAAASSLVSRATRRGYHRRSYR